MSHADLTDAEALALKLQNQTRYGIDGPIVITEPVTVPDAQEYKFSSLRVICTNCGKDMILISATDSLLFCCEKCKQDWFDCSPSSSSDSTEKM